MRTIADLEDVAEISTTHISETIQYRSLGREGCWDKTQITPDKIDKTTKNKNKGYFPYFKVLFPLTYK